MDKKSDKKIETQPSQFDILLDNFHRIPFEERQARLAQWCDLDPQELQILRGINALPIETAEQLAALQSARPNLPPASQMPIPADTHWQPGAATGSQGPSAPVRETPVVPTRAPSTTIDALEREFERKKARELEAARMAGGDASSASATPRRSGETIGRNDPCFCGSGKKYKKCHGANA